jgi:hypothetical protein
MAITKKDWTLLALAAADGRPLSPVQLQKALFIFGQRMPKAVAHDFYDFRPYNYGPFDAKIYSDAEELARGGAVGIVETGKSWSQYAATPDGIARAKELLALVPRDAGTYLRSLVAWVASLSFQDLLRAVYEKYPEYAVNSVFRR